MSSARPDHAGALGRANEKIARYDMLRGYPNTAPAPAGHQHQHGG